MSYQLYLLIHIASVIILFSALGGLVFTRWHHGGAEGKPPFWGMLMALHGLALFFLLFSGFGLMARLNISHGAMWPTWLMIKFGLWLLLGAWVVVVKRIYTAPAMVFLSIPLIGILVAWSAIYKPGEAEYRAAQAEARADESVTDADDAADAGEPTAPEATDAATDDTDPDADESIEVEVPSPDDVTGAVEDVERRVGDAMDNAAERIERAQQEDEE